MGTAIPVKRRLGAADLRKRACASQDSDQARRLLALAAVLDGQSRGAAARIGGMDRQTLRDWVHAYNAKGVQWSDQRSLAGAAAEVEGAEGEAAPNNRGWPGSGERRRGALALQCICARTSSPTACSRAMRPFSTPASTPGAASLPRPDASPPLALATGP